MLLPSDMQMKGLTITKKYLAPQREKVPLFLYNKNLEQRGRRKNFEG